MKKKKNMTPWVLLCLHLLLLVYSASGVFSKMASGCSVASIWFYIWYSGTLGILFVYAIGWQQIIKRIPLTLAFANKAVTVIWGMVWGTFIFGESISVGMIAGALLVIVGIALYSTEGKGSAPERKLPKNEEG